MGFFGLFGGKPSRDEFAALVAQRLKASGEARTVQYDKTTFSLQVESDTAFNLENVYRYYCEAPKGERERVLAEFLASWAETSAPIPKDWAEAAPKVLPYVRPLEYFSLSSLQLQLEGKPLRPPPHRPLGEELGIYLAFDRPSSIASVDAEQLAAWGVSFEEALDQARDNLRRDSAAPFQQDSPGVYVSPWRGPYDCSRLALPELFHRLQVAGARVAMVPNRDVLIVTGADDRRGLQRMGEIAAEVLRQPRPLGAEALQLEPGGWAPFPLHHEVPEHRGLIELRYGQRMGSYEEQKRLLDALHEKTGQDIFVASYVVTRQKDGGVMTSYSTWTDGVDALIPQADRIAFVRLATKETFMVRWDDARQIVGHRMQALDMMPPRYSVKQPPDQAEYARLKAKVI
jgi:hypothetical protein